LYCSAITNFWVKPPPKLVNIFLKVEKHHEHDMATIAKQSNGSNSARKKTQMVDSIAQKMSKWCQI